MSIVTNLQGHQLVLQKELAEVNNDIVALQQMAARYTAQCGISFASGVDHLVALRAQKERLLFQVTNQLNVMQDTVASSTYLVQQLNASGIQAAATSAVSAVTRATPMMSPPGRSTRVNVPSAVDVTSSYAFAGDVVHLHGPGGLVVSTNSSILAHSPQRERL